MKGPFSFWAFFGLTIWIDLITAFIFLFIKKKKVKVGGKPTKEVSVLVPVHKETLKDLEKTIHSVYNEKYPIKKLVICSDKDSRDLKDLVESMSEIYDNILYLECPDRSKAKKINYAAKKLGDSLGRYLYVKDCKSISLDDNIKQMLAYFNDKKVAAVTSHGFLTPPRNFLSRSYHHGKEWINHLGKFRKKAQELRSSVFVVCGASTIYRVDLLKKYPIPHTTKTEDTHYTWVLQLKGYKIMVANKANVSAPDVDGKWFLGIRNQLKQAFRWSSGTLQCLYIERKNLKKNKKLFYTTILPGFIEAITYSLVLVTLPLWFFISPAFAIGFLIGDTIFSLLGTVILMPQRLIRTILHYPQIFFFKYMSALVFVTSLFVVGAQIIRGKTRSWSNEWTPINSSGDEIIVHKKQRSNSKVSLYEKAKIRLTA